MMLARLAALSLVGLLAVSCALPAFRWETVHGFDPWRRGYELVFPVEEFRFPGGACRRPPWFLPLLATILFGIGVWCLWNRSLGLAGGFGFAAGALAWFVFYLFNRAPADLAPGFYCWLACHPLLFVLS